MKPATGVDRFVLRDWTSVLALISLVGALAVLGLGWGLGFEIFVRLSPGLPAMVPETAATLVLASIGTLAAINRWPSYVGVATTLALGALVVTYFVSPVVRSGLSSGDGMAVATGFCLLCLGISIAATTMPGTGAQTVAFAAGGLCALASGTALMAHALASVSVRDVLGFREMALHTAGGAFLLNLALILSSRDSPHFRGLLGPGRQSKVLPVVGVLALCGLVRLATRNDWITAEFRLVFLCSAMITLLVASALVVGYQVERLEAEKTRLSALKNASDRALQSIEINSERDENLRILGQIVAGVAHDFNNALTALRGNLELMQVDPAKAGEYLDEAIRAADRAAGLTGQLLESGRQTRLQIGEGDVVAVAEQVIGLYIRITQRLITSGYAATFNFNAGLAPGDYVVIEVSDTGTGMDATTIARAVQPYFTTKGVGKGSGLGLASVNGVCQQQGGGLLIRSAPGEGTTVIIALPVFVPAASAGVAEDPELPFDVLLLAGAARRHRDFLEYLHRQGRMVRHVRTEAEAIDFLETNRLPSVVLIDEGDQVKADIEERFTGLPVVYVVDYSETRRGFAVARWRDEEERACA